jgi:hypothetical protein
MRTTKLWLLTACLAGSLTSALSAQAPAPPPPAKYDAVLRYRIIAPRDQHALLYDRLIAELGRLGFEFQPPLDQRLETDRIDPTKNTLRGLIPSKNVAAIRDLPNVGGLLLVPAGMKLPDASDTPVRAREHSDGRRIALRPATRPSGPDGAAAEGAGFCRGAGL